MIAEVVVHPSGEFETWLENAAQFLERMTPVDAGRTLYVRRGCVQCHSLDGTARVGPSFKGVFGTEQQLEDGSTITVDENYLRESILQPQAKVRAGYKGVMPVYSARSQDEQRINEEISAIIAFIKSLK
jgi:cytochrome c oxidase subunit 2